MVEHPDTCAKFLHNSFMGAMLRIPEGCALPKALSDKWRTQDIPYDPDLYPDSFTETLIRNGFILKADRPERDSVRAVLDMEVSRIAHFILLPHEDCNFRYTYCYETFERGKMRPEVVEAVKKAFYRRTHDAEVMNVSWFGGEPTLAFDVLTDLSVYFVDLCERKGLEYVSSITTNGANLERQGERKIAKLRLSHFQITLDGPPDIHDKLRVRRGGQGTFEIVWKNLLFLRNTSLDSRFCIRINITPQSVGEVLAFLPRLADAFAGDRRFYLDFHTVGHWGGANDEDIDIFSGSSGHAAKMELFRAAQRAGFGLITQQDTTCAHGSTCYAGNPNSVVIGSDGTLYKCTVAFEDERNKVGKLLADGTFDIDQAKFDLWTRDHLGSGKCSTCTFGAACQGKSCPLNSLDDQEPNCPFTVEQLTESLLFAAGPK